MERNNSFHKAIGELNLFERLYDYVRVVDPINKNVNYYLKPQPAGTDDVEPRCYKLWGKGDLCENCISVRAFNQEDTFVKIEYKSDQVWMAAAVPVVLEDNKVVVEFVKNITETGLIDIEGKESGEIHKIIDRKNRLIVSDALTGIYNNRFIDERLPYDMASSRDSNSYLTLFFISINNFKAINNLYGHAAGNHTAKELAKLIKKYCRDRKDWVARYGGMEFILCLSGADDKRAHQVYKRLYKKIDNTTFHYAGNEVKAAVSIGFYTLLNENITAEEFIKRAGKSTYTMTEAGKTADSGKIDKVAVYEQFEQKLFLTVRESEVAELLLQGLSNTEIAERIFVSNSTVKKHISSIFNKVNVKSRSEFIAKYSYITRI